MSKVFRTEARLPRPMEMIMTEYRLPVETAIGHVHLQVSDLEGALAFYGSLLGFRQVARDGLKAMLSATGQAPYHVVLTERSGARRKPGRTTGLYHVATRFPNRRALSRVFRRLVAHEWPFQGFADHPTRTVAAAEWADRDGDRSAGRRGPVG